MLTLKCFIRLPLILSVVAVLLYIHCNIIIIVVFVVIDTTSNRYAIAIAMITCFLSTVMSTTIVTLYSRCPMHHFYLRGRGMSPLPSDKGGHVRGERLSFHNSS